MSYTQTILFSFLIVSSLAAQSHACRACLDCLAACSSRSRSNVSHLPPATTTAATAGPAAQVMDAAPPQTRPVQSQPVVRTTMIDMATLQAFYAGEFHDLGNAIHAITLVSLLVLDPRSAPDINQGLVARVEQSVGEIAQLRNSALANLRSSHSRPSLPTIPFPELMTHLGVIHRTIPTIRLDPTSDVNAEYLEDIHASLGEVSAILRVLNHMQSGNVNGNFPLEDMVFTPANLLMPVGRSMQGRARSSGVTLQLPQATNSGMQSRLVGDLHLLHRVVRNLVNNAIKFTPSGGTVTVMIDTTPDPAHDGQVLATILVVMGQGQQELAELVAQYLGVPSQVLAIRVSDTGPGVPDAMRDRLFQPYSQIDADRLQAGGGHGLGLWVSRRIVESFNSGRIYHLHGSAGGSVFGFTVSLPRLPDTIKIIRDGYST